MQLVNRAALHDAVRWNPKTEPADELSATPAFRSPENVFPDQIRLGPSAAHRSDRSQARLAISTRRREINSLNAKPAPGRSIQLATKRANLKLRLTKLREMNFVPGGVTWPKSAPQRRKKHP
jgi:hypothetical protein